MLRLHDTATGTVKAKARFNNGAGLLFPNQFVNARLLIDSLCNAVVVPTAIILPPLSLASVMSRIVCSGSV